MIRHTLQAQLYATQVRLNQLEGDANQALTTVSVIGTPTVRQQTVRGDLHLVVECDFLARQDGETIVQAVIDRAVQRSAVAPSYVWLKSVDDQALAVAERSAAAPGWVVSENTVAI